MHNRISIFYFILFYFFQGVLAKNKDLMKAFGTDNQLEACRIILDTGEMQVSTLHTTRKRGKVWAGV